MIVTRNKLLLAVHSESSGEDGATVYVREATGKVIENLSKDDVLCDATNTAEEDGTEVIHSLSGLRKRYRVPMLVATMSAIALAACAIALTYAKVRLAIAQDVPVWTKMFVPALLFSLSMLYVNQCINPVLRSTHGDLVNLRTGKTNLSNGCIIN